VDQFHSERYERGSVHVFSEFQHYFHFDTSSFTFNFGGPRKEWPIREILPCRGSLRDDLRGLRICYAASLQYTLRLHVLHIGDRLHTQPIVSKIWHLTTSNNRPQPPPPLPPSAYPIFTLIPRSVGSTVWIPPLPRQPSPSRSRNSTGPCLSFPSL
jgi:hypothetical protein